MKPRRFLPLLTALACLSSALAVSAAPLEFVADGFKIEPLDQPAGPPVTKMAVSLSMPPSEGFAANVNVMVQVFDGSMDDFIGLSKKQFNQMNAKLLLDKKISEKEWLAEYAARLPQGELHFYSRAVAEKGKVYLITATDREAGWAKNAAALKKCVDSFALAK